MSVIINGIKNLDANDYERIIIKFNDGDYHVAVKGKNEHQKLTSTSKISNELKSVSDDEKIKRIIQYFLDYSKITFLSDKQFYPYYNNSFSTAKGSRQLDLQMDKKGNFDIPEVIIDKYINDRLLFVCDMKSISNYEFCYNPIQTSYGFIGNIEKPCIRFNLIGRKGKLLDFEKQFLNRFIGDILENSTEEAIVARKKQYASKTKSYYEGETYFTCGDVSINLFGNDEIISEVKSMTLTHNELIKKSKENQLKLGGF